MSALRNEGAEETVLAFVKVKCFVFFCQNKNKNSSARMEDPNLLRMQMEDPKKLGVCWRPVYP